MPTSNGLSYSTYSLPRSEWMTGAPSVLASSTTSAWAPAHPAPHIMATLLSALSSAASASRSPSAGRTTGGLGAIQAGALTSVGFSAMSPGITTTATPRLAVAIRIAFSRMRGRCSMLETSST
jgi:hypothetical protein